MHKFNLYILTSEWSSWNQWQCTHSHHSQTRTPGGAESQCGAPALESPSHRKRGLWCWTDTQAGIHRISLQTGAKECKVNWCLHFSTVIQTNYKCLKVSHIRLKQSFIIRCKKAIHLHIQNLVWMPSSLWNSWITLHWSLTPGWHTQRNQVPTQTLELDQRPCCVEPWLCR